jgi:hypothetical protein
MHDIENEATEKRKKNTLEKRARLKCTIQKENVTSWHENMHDDMRTVRIHVVIRLITAEVKMIKKFCGTLPKEQKRDREARIDQEARICMTENTGAAGCRGRVALSQCTTKHGNHMPTATTNANTIRKRRGEQKHG